MADQQQARSRAHDVEHSDVPSALALRVKALESLLLEKGIVEQEAIDRMIDFFESGVGPHIGARVVARAWTDPAYREQLLQDGNAAVAALGYPMLREGARLVALENTSTVHNVVVCTLCSCYPMPLLGLPPVWYKSAPFRSRVVMDPRGVLEEFGTELADDVEVRVWDSNSEARYLVIPERPPGTERLSEEDLVRLVGRNAMIGVERARMPVVGPET